MSAHTPGPWRAVGHAIYGPFTPLGREAIGAVVCSTTTINRPRHLADARLIAAAPDLLEALKNAARIMETFDVGVDRDIRAAIAKAEGR